MRAPAKAQALWLAADGGDVVPVDIPTEALRAAAERARDTPQYSFYERLARQAAPGGTLLIVAHDSHGHRHGRPDNAVTAAATNRSLLDSQSWPVQSAEIRERGRGAAGHGMRLQDVVVCARRL